MRNGSHRCSHFPETQSAETLAMAYVPKLPKVSGAAGHRDARGFMTFLVLSKSFIKPPTFEFSHIAD